MHTATPPLKLTEAQMVQLTRNALLVAGQEMGETGDHWPVIKSTIHSIMKDWEQLQIERNVHAELKIQLYEQLREMERILPTCTADVQADAAPKLKELREVYDAYFTDIDEDKLILDDAEVPQHVKRAKAIIETLEAEDA
jgi:hypothetical protein